MCDTIIEHESSHELEEALQIVKKLFIECVIERSKESGIPINNFLNLSQIKAIASRYLKSSRKPRTFSIGLPDSVGQTYAETVSKHCDNDRVHIELDQEEFLNMCNIVIPKISN